MDSRILDLIEFPFYFQKSAANVSLPQLAEWAEAVDMNMYYCGNFVYFDTEKDKAMFIIKWI